MHREVYEEVYVQLEPLLGDQAADPTRARGCDG